MHNFNYYTMDVKSCFYYSSVIESSEHNISAETESIFKKTIQFNNITANSRAGKIIKLVNSLGKDINYDYLCGWEAAKVLLPKICTDCSYIVRILIVGQSEQFLAGFNYYRIMHFAPFEIEYYVYTFGKYLINGGIIKKQKQWNTHSDYVLMTSQEQTVKYDGIVSCDFSAVASLHSKGFYLNIVPRDSFEILIMYAAFIWKTSILFDTPILSELFILSSLVRNKSRLSSTVTIYIPEKSTSSPIYSKIFDEIFSQLNLRNLRTTLVTRHDQLSKLDYQSQYFELNPELIISNENSSELRIDSLLA